MPWRVSETRVCVCVDLFRELSKCMTWAWQSASPMRSWALGPTKLYADECEYDGSACNERNALLHLLRHIVVHFVWMLERVKWLFIACTLLCVFVCLHNWKWFNGRLGANAYTANHSATWDSCVDRLWSVRILLRAHCVICRSTKTIT